MGVSFLSPRRLVIHRFRDIGEQAEGFEPSKDFSALYGLSIRRIRPLCHTSTKSGLGTGALLNSKTEGDTITPLPKGPID